MSLVIIGDGSLAIEVVKKALQSKVIKKLGIRSNLSTQFDTDEHVEIEYGQETFISDLVLVCNTSWEDSQAIAAAYRYKVPVLSTFARGSLYMCFVQNTRARVVVTERHGDGLTLLLEQPLPLVPKAVVITDSEGRVYTANVVGADGNNINVVAEAGLLCGLSENLTEQVYVYPTQPDTIAQAFNSECSELCNLFMHALISLYYEHSNCRSFEQFYALVSIRDPNPTHKALYEEFFSFAPTQTSDELFSTLIFGQVLQVMNGIFPPEMSPRLQRIVSTLYFPEAEIHSLQYKVSELTAHTEQLKFMHDREKGELNRRITSLEMSLRSEQDKSKQYLQNWQDSQKAAQQTEDNTVLQEKKTKKKSKKQRDEHWNQNEDMQFLEAAQEDLGNASLKTAPESKGGIQGPASSLWNIAGSYVSNLVPKLTPPPSNPLSLPNLGATCFLASMVQLLYVGYIYSSKRILNNSTALGTAATQLFTKGKKANWQDFCDRFYEMTGLTKGEEDDSGNALGQFARVEWKILRPDFNITQVLQEIPVQCEIAQLKSWEKHISYLSYYGDNEPDDFGQELATGAFFDKKCQQCGTIQQRTYISKLPSVLFVICGNTFSLLRAAREFFLPVYSYDPCQQSVLHTRSDRYNLVGASLYINEHYVAICKHQNSWWVCNDGARNLAEWSTIETKYNDTDVQLMVFIRDN